MATTELDSIAVINNPQAPFTINGQWPTWAITHFIPVYDPDIDVDIHNTNIPASAVSAVVTSTLNFAQIKGQRLYNLREEMIEHNGALVKCKPVWKYYNSNGSYFGQHPATGANMSSTGGLFMPFNTMSAANVISPLDQPAMTPYNVVEWYTSDTSAYVKTTIPGLEPLSVTSTSTTNFAMLDASSQIININFQSSTLEATFLQPIKSFDGYLSIRATEPDGMRDLDSEIKRLSCFNAIKYTGSISDVNNPNSERTSGIQGQFVFTVEPTLGNFRFNKIIFYSSFTPAEDYDNIQHLERPQFFGHLGFAAAETVGKTNSEGLRTRTGILSHVNVVAQLRFNPGVENTPVMVINVNDWQRSMSPERAVLEDPNTGIPMPGRFRKVFAVQDNPWYGFVPETTIEGEKVYRFKPEQLVYDSGSSATSIRHWNEDIAGHYIAMSYSGDIGIGQNNSMNGEGGMANGGLPNMQTPRAKLHISQTSQSYAYLQNGAATEYTYVNTYFPHIRLSDKTSFTGMDFRFFDVIDPSMSPICFDPEVEDTKIRLPRKGLMTITGGFGYIGGLGIAIGQNAIADAEITDARASDERYSFFYPLMNSNNFALSIGTGSRAYQAANSLALGEYAQVYHANSYAIGRGAAVTVELGHSIGPGAKSAPSPVLSTLDFVDGMNGNAKDISVTDPNARNRTAWATYHGSFSQGQETWADNGVAIGYYAKAWGAIYTVAPPTFNTTAIADTTDLSCGHGHTCGCCECIRANYLLLTRNNQSAINIITNNGRAADAVTQWRDYFALSIGLDTLALSRAAAIGYKIQSLFHDCYAFGTDIFARQRESMTLGFHNRLQAPYDTHQAVMHNISLGVQLDMLHSGAIGSTADSWNAFSSVFQARSVRNILLGFQMTTNSSVNCIGIGQGMNMYGFNSAIGIGVNNNIANGRVIAIGREANTGAEENISIGHNISVNPRARKYTIGTNLRNYGWQSVLIGAAILHDTTNDDTARLADNSVMIGSEFLPYMTARQSDHRTLDGRMVGIGCRLGLSDNCVNIGQANRAYGYNAITVGHDNNVVNRDGMAVALANITGAHMPNPFDENNILIGNDNRVCGHGGIAIGTNNLLFGTTYAESNNPNRLFSGVSIGNQNSVYPIYRWWASLNDSDSTGAEAPSTVSTINRISCISNIVSTVADAELSGSNYKESIAIGNWLDASYSDVVVGHGNVRQSILYPTTLNNNDNIRTSEFRNIYSHFVIGGGIRGMDNQANVLEVGKMIFNRSNNEPIDRTMIIIGGTIDRILPSRAELGLTNSAADSDRLIQPGTLFVGTDGLVRMFSGYGTAGSDLPIEDIRIYDNGNCAAFVPENE